MTALIWTANILGWPLIHLAVGALAVRLPPVLFAHDTWFTAPRRWEQQGNFYRKWVAIRTWKSLLPDGAPWIGGTSKKNLAGRTASDLEKFMIETRRAEWAHWCMFCCLPVFFLWNPPWAWLVMCAYAAAANLPCILAQRYNRLTLARVLHKRRGRRAAL